MHPTSDPSAAPPTASSTSSQAPAAPATAAPSAPAATAQRRQPSGCLGLLSRRFGLVLLLAVLFFLGVGLLLVFAFGDDGPVPAQAVLVMQPEGVLVEQLSGDPVSRALGALTGDYQPETVVRDLVDALDEAQNDDRIQALYLDLDGLAGGGMDKLLRVRQAVADFRAAGKRVLAVGDAYAKGGYLIATAADEVSVDPMGGVVLDGFGRYRTYHREGLERYEIDMNVLRVGDYKSAVEPYLRDSMSEEAREANLEWLGDLWSSYLDHVSEAREMDPQTLRAQIAALDEELASQAGDFSALSLALGWVDALRTREEIRQELIELVGEDEEHHTFQQVATADYLKATGRRGGLPTPMVGEGVGVVIASGTILDGEQPAGSIGGDTVARLIRQARFDESIKALVLRVDSGGGSAFASEVIRRELDLVRQAGKPVIASMGTLAASGGYWISTASDEIWAHPDTITGSIGIFGYFPTFQRPLEKYLGTRVDGVGTTWLAGAVRPDKELDPRVYGMLEDAIGHGYQQFLERVAEARNMTLEEVDAVGQGRVWSGADAFEYGLVDHLGTYEDALDAAARLAGLDDEYGVKIVRDEPTFFETLTAEMMTSRAQHVAPLVQRSRLARSLEETLSSPLRAFDRFEDPNGLYADCLCDYR
ncbi:MAG: signal peptide peptidase SppA [Acidobacteriota bacterium]